MRIISKSRLRAFWELPGCHDAEGPLRAWYTHVGNRAVAWQSWSEVRAFFGNASLIGNCVVFNIGGHKFRLVTRILYPSQKVFVLKVMTHKQYDQDTWKDECGCFAPPPRRARFSRSKRTKNNFGSSGVPGGCSRRFIVSHLISVDLLSQMCDALSAAHAEGITHRDVHPSNFKLGPKDEGKLIDWGVAHRPGSTFVPTPERLTGTFSIMSPEAFQDAFGDPRGDIYSVGCCLFLCLTGRLPYYPGNKEGHRLTRRASKGSGSFSSLARRVAMRQHAELRCWGNTERLVARMRLKKSIEPLQSRDSLTSS